MTETESTLTGVWWESCPTGNGMPAEEGLIAPAGTGPEPEWSCAEHARDWLLEGDDPVTFMAERFTLADPSGFIEGVYRREVRTRTINPPPPTDDEGNLL